MQAPTTFRRNVRIPHAHKPRPTVTRDEARETMVYALTASNYIIGEALSIKQEGEDLETFPESTSEH